MLIGKKRTTKRKNVVSKIGLKINKKVERLET